MFRRQRKNRLILFAAVVLYSSAMLGCTHVPDWMKGSPDQSEANSKWVDRNSGWVDENSECRQILNSSLMGEHKAAVDALAELAGKGQSCPDDVYSAVEVSRYTLNRADSLVKKAFDEKRKGNLPEARENLTKALAVYPKYYWVKKLLSVVDRSIALRVEALMEEAQYLEAQNDLEGALDRLNMALVLLPDKPELKAGAARLESEIQTGRLHRMAEKSLEKARFYLEQKRFLDAQKTIEEGNALIITPLEAGRVLDEIHRLRQGWAEEALAAAGNAEKDGDLRSAFYYVGVALSQGPLDEGVLGDIIEFSRLLGMKFYSKGKLSQAQEVWILALDYDPNNSKIRGYLEEVEDRLDSLRKIQEAGDGTKP